jgi:hypothetical protein
MRRRVQDALDEAGYRPNATARSLRTGRTGLIGLAVPRLHDPYFAQLADAVIAAAAEQGWTVYLASGENFPDALAGAALAGHQHAPLLLTHREALHPDTVAALERLSAGEVVILGGSMVISLAVAKQAASYSTTGSVRRFGRAGPLRDGGLDRRGTVSRRHAGLRGVWPGPPGRARWSRLSRAAGRAFGADRTGPRAYRHRPGADTPGALLHVRTWWANGGLRFDDGCPGAIPGCRLDPPQ